MKLMTLAALAATMFSLNAHAVREHGGRHQMPTWSCAQYDEEAGRRVIIDAAPTWVHIQYEAPNEQYETEMTVEERPFTREITPEVWCDQSGEDGYSIRIQVRGGVVQILQSSPTGRYAPVQLEEVK